VHKDYLLSFNQIGSNLCGDKNGRVGGQKLIKCHGVEKMNQRVNPNDCRYTTLAFTAATGEPVLAVIIIEGAKLENGEMYRTHMRVLHNNDTPFADVSDILTNTGKGKLYPKGPVCEF